MMKLIILCGWAFFDAYSFTAALCLVIADHLCGRRESK